MIRTLNTILYRSYLNRQGLSIGQLDDYYAIIEDQGTLLYTFHMVRILTGRGTK